MGLVCRQTVLPVKDVTPCLTLEHLATETRTFSVVAKPMALIELDLPLLFLSYGNMLISIL